MTARKRPLAALTDRRTTTAIERPLAGAIEAPLAAVLPDPDQPRRDWEHGDGPQRLDELAQSIREFGVLQPLLVREDEGSTEAAPLYRIISGGRRRAAAELAGLTVVPVVVRTEASVRIRVLQLIENLQRQDLSPLDEGRAYKDLMELERLSPQAVAERLHINGQTVRDRLRLLADQILADAVERRQISATAARDITRLPDEQLQEFRARVEAGEIIQSNDVAVARAHLRAQGYIHPRLKKPPTSLPRNNTSYYPSASQQTPGGPPPPPTFKGAGPTQGNDGGLADLSDAPTSEHAVAPVATEPDPRQELARSFTAVLVGSQHTAPRDALAVLEAVLTGPDGAEWSKGVMTEVALRWRQA